MPHEINTTFATAFNKHYTKLLKANNMATSSVKYLGNLRTECTHERSGTKIITDAPIDNNGMGEAFSPTDLLATSYASCMITIIGIHCNKNGLSFKSAEASVVKSMGSGPRKVSAIDINLDLSGNNWTEEEKKAVIAAAEVCPVALSVSDAISVNINYTF
jgi:uncharacterized OsmC-like protein